MKNLVRKKVFKLLKSGVAVLGIALAGVASADPMKIFISDPNVALSVFPGPYAEVTYDLLNPTRATFTFTSLSGYLLGGQSSAAVNFSGSVALVGAITGNSACASPYSLDSGNVSEFGTFNFIVDTFNGANCASTSITFTVDLLNGGMWANNAAILTPNNNGSLAAAHVFAGCIGAPPNRSCQVTGFAGNGGGGPPNEIPEPQTLALLGLGLLGLAFMRRRYKA